MKKLFATLVLFMPLVAMGQTYHFTAPAVPAMQDVTSMTATVNAWKYFPGTPVCIPGGGTLVYGSLDSSISCLGQVGSYPYRYNNATKQWEGHPEMGTPSYIAVVNWGNSNLAANLYALIRTTTCNTNNGFDGLQFYDVFHWNTSTNQWVQPRPGTCVAGISADYKGNLSIIGIDTVHNVTAWFQSTNGGTSWNFLADSYKFINMADTHRGCAISNAGGIWQVYTSGTPSALPALPSGTAAGCIITQTPITTMAWTTTGQVYVIPEDASAWQSVTGISLKTAVGNLGYYIFGEDTSGKPYHWNTNAPGLISTYGGQWTPAQGCPTPGTPCNNPTTHTLHHSLQFTTCHGINGCNESQSTALWSANFSVPHSDYNPQCDPYLGGGVDDPECHVAESAYGHCNASGATLDPTGTINWVVGDSIDVMDYTYNVSSNGPVRHQTQLYQGFYVGTVTNAVTDGCALSDPRPVCPVDSPVTIYNKETWWGGLDAEAAAYAEWHTYQGEYVSGESSPYIFHSFYIAEETDMGLDHVNCFGPYAGDSDFLYGNIDAAPACK